MRAYLRKKRAVETSNTSEIGSESLDVVIDIQDASDIEPGDKLRAVVAESNMGGEQAYVAPQYPTLEVPELGIYYDVVVTADVPLPSSLPVTAGIVVRVPE